MSPPVSPEKDLTTSSVPTPVLAPPSTRRALEYVRRCFEAHVVPSQVLRATDLHLGFGENSEDVAPRFNGREYDLADSLPRPPAWWTWLGILPPNYLSRTRRIISRCVAKYFGSPIGDDAQVWVVNIIEFRRPEAPRLASLPGPRPPLHQGFPCTAAHRGGLARTVCHRVCTRGSRRPDERTCARIR